jgi:hypothetical protein
MTPGVEWQILRIAMARLERIELVQFPDYDDKIIEGLIELGEKHGVTAPIRRIKCHLIDRTVNEVHPQYVLCEDDDMMIWPQCLTDSSVDLGKHRSEYVAIAVCQEHHDSIYGSSL